MQEIKSSASKIVLLTLVAVLAILSLVAGVHSVLTGEFNDASKAILASFAGSLTFVFGYYFNSKGDPTLPNAGK